jgi:hypothetical protein
MAQVQAWDNEKFKIELCKRLKQAKRYRQKFEEQWKINERTLFNWNSRDANGVTLTEDNTVSIDDVENSNDVTEMAVNYAWKFQRFILSQMSSNPPSVIARPTSPDDSDRQKADAADRIVRHGYHDKDVQELFDQSNLKCLTYGTGWTKGEWDPDAGDTFEFDEKEGELTMTGDINTYSPSTWNMWIDPDAKSWRTVRYVFERLEVPIDEAKFRWSDSIEEIERFAVKKSSESMSTIQDWAEHDGIIEVYLYTERGMPINGMAGRMAACLEDGSILGKPTANKNPGAVLGYQMITDVDVPDQVYGKSFVEYIYKLQDLLNRLDTSFVDNVAAHNVVRMVLPEGCEVEDTSVSNSSWDWLKITGNSGNGPYYAPAAQLMPDAHKLRENLVGAIMELAGVNDALQGNSSREVSGFSLQTMIDAANTVRRRLFNKYTLMVRDFWKNYLALARENWNEPRTIKVIGKEHALEAADFSGADINGGFDIICEYGVSLSLDPARRREEIMQLMPIFEKAGIPPKTVLSMLKLNEIESLYDRMQQAESRQREIFQEIIAKRQPVEVRDLQDHAGMLDFAYSYVMSAEFKYLDSELQGLIEDHVHEREQKAKQAAVTPEQAAQTAGAEAPAGAGLPVLGAGPAAPPAAPPAVAVA